MYRVICCVLMVFIFVSCQQGERASEDLLPEIESSDSSYKLVFASCNDPHRPMPLWKPIVDNKPSTFIWGGDNIYADTDDMGKMKADYDLILANKDYQELKNNEVGIIGTWDDHDYGKNDAGKEWEKKEEAKELLLEFLEPYNKEVNTHEGVYTWYKLMPKDKSHSIKVILLDTRTFRDSMNPSNKIGWRYEAWPEDGVKRTILGDEQWSWLEEQLEDDSDAFTVIVSSIQFLNDEHGWEKWGNFPTEIEKMNEVLVNAKSKNIIILSGDRHMAEISSKELEGLDYPLIDFTSSGLTHTWIDGATESNRYRKSNVIKHLNFGILNFDFKKESVTFQIRGENNFLYEEFTQQY